MKFAYLVPSVLTVGTIALAASVTPASAISLTVGGAPAGDGSGLTTAVPGATVVDFNSQANTSNLSASFAIPNSTVTYTGGGVVGPGSTSGLFAAPLNDTTKYYSVGPSTTEPGTVAVTFGNDLTYFGLYWGSIDSYNTISFFKDGALLRAFNGADTDAPANGDQFDPNNNLYVNFFADPGESFDTIVFNSTGQNAFESDNHAYTAVPEPLTMLGVGTAIGFGGYFKKQISKRRKKDKANG